MPRLEIKYQKGKVFFYGRPKKTDSYALGSVHPDLRTYPTVPVRPRSVFRLERFREAFRPRLTSRERSRRRAGIGTLQPWTGFREDGAQGAAACPWHSAFKHASKHYDLVFACINGNDNLRHDEAVDLAMVLEPELIVPMHYGMDPGNTVDPQIFVDEISNRFPTQSYVVPEVGGRILID